MAKTQEWKDWGRAMKAWLKELLVWQANNPDKDWLTELSSVNTLDSGGDHPPLPPPKP